MIKNLFNSDGQFIAFIKNRYVYDYRGKWIGWLPWNENEVIDIKGKYLGSIVSENRLYQFGNHPYRGYPGYPGYPGFPGIPISPCNIDKHTPPHEAKDISIKQVHSL